MTRRVFRALLAATVAVLLSVLLLVGGVLGDYLIGNERERLSEEAAILAAAEDPTALTLPRGLRLTLIARDGRVLYDSRTDAAAMENHAARPEVAAALAEGSGTATRRSATLGERAHYAAALTESGAVLRVSRAPFALWILFFTVLLPCLPAAGIAVLFLSRLAERITEHIVSPLNDPNGAEQPPMPELAPFYRALAEERARYRMQTAELSRRRDEFLAATRHMSEGLLLLGADRTVLSINRAATALLEPDPPAIGERLCASVAGGALEELCIRAERIGPQEGTVTLAGEVRRSRVTPILIEGRTVGFVLLFFSLGERERAERMRREFTANVSHELKTPLHTIAGSAELLSCGLVKQEDVPEFAGRIHAEALRLVALVEDILRLSRLDEGAAPSEAVTLDLAALAREEADRLLPVATEAGLTLTAEGEQVPMQGYPPLVSEIVFNLLDNAIKYNRPHGTVCVSATADGGDAVLTVRDSGIGIPEEYRDRIFERFFRVDKSHSKEVGGTGLGLSIVKHAAALHGASITLASETGVGTEITVRFPAHTP